MPYTPATVAAVAAMRVALDEAMDADERALAGAWSAAWQEVADEFSAAIDELLAVGDGEWPSRGQINRASRATRALQIVAGKIDELANTTLVTVTGTLDTLVADAVTYAQKITASQLPDADMLTWTRVDEKAVQAIVERAAGQVTALSRPLSVEATQAMKSTLIRGVLVGENPRAAARQMLNRVHGAFNGGYQRALTITSTELIDAHRAAAAATHNANAEVLAGWTWTCEQSSRTCPGCLSLDGTEHPLDEAGPIGHQRCRCTRVPRSKTWRELGFNIDEPASTRQTAQDWFNEQPRETQVAIMGEKRLAQLNSGRLSFDQMAVRRANPGWRDGYYVRPLAA